jgi:hypothetical protein
MKQRRIEELEQENGRLKRQRSSPSQWSPRNRSNDILDNTANVVAAIADTGTGATAAADEEAAKQAPKEAGADNLLSMLDGVSGSHDKVGGILVTDKLEHLWKLGSSSIEDSKGVGTGSTTVIKVLAREAIAL